VVKPPNYLTNKKMQTVSSHASNTPELSLKNSPESFNVVGVNYPSNELTVSMIDILMMYP
jgi:hypothetical protein